MIQSLHTEVCMQSIPRTTRPNTEAPLSSSNSPASCPSTLSLITSWILNLSWDFLSFNVITLTCKIKTRSDIIKQLLFMGYIAHWSGHHQKYHVAINCNEYCNTILQLLKFIWVNFHRQSIFYTCSRGHKLFDSSILL